MRLGLDAKRAFCNERGLGQYSRNLIDGLGLYASEIEIYAFTTERRLAYKPLGANTQVIESPWPILKSLWRGFAINREIKNLEIDIYHGLSHEIPWGLTGRKKPKTCVTMHDLLYLKHPEWFPFWDREIYRRKYSSACQRANRIWSISRQTTEDLQEYLGVPAEKIFTGYQSCHPRFYERVDQELKNELLKKIGVGSAPYILFVGAFEDRKNVSALIEAFRLLQSSHSDLKLLAVGPRSKVRDRIRSQMEKMNLEEKIIFAETVRSEDLPAIYQSARALAFPSLEEGFGIPIIEALFSMCPVVLKDDAHFREIAGAGGKYVDVSRPEDLAEGLRCILDNSKTRRDLVEAGAIHVQRFHQKKISQDLISFYKSQLGR